ncbi:hypothetical protein GCM10027341_09820 [Spirosoma knui]
MHPRFLTSLSDLQSNQPLFTNGLITGNSLLIVGLLPEFRQKGSIRIWAGWLFCLLFLGQTLISLGQTGTTVAGGQGPGANPNQLNNPTSLYVTSNSVVYVADYNNNRIQKWAVGATAGVTVAGGGPAGSGAHQLNKPFGVFVGTDGAIYVCDAGNHRVQKWAPNATTGVTVAGGNGAGKTSTQLNAPTGIYVSADGTLYVADFLNDRVQQFPPNSTSATPGQTVAGGHSEGGNANQLRHPEGVVVDETTGTVYVADTYNHRVQKWLPNANEGITVAGSTTAGAGASQLNTAFGLYRDSNGYIYIADAYNHRIQKWGPGDTQGTTVAGLNAVGTDADHLDTPQGVFLDGNKRIYVVDHANHRVQRFGSCLSPIATLSNNGTITCATTSVLLTAGGGGPEDTYTFSNGAIPLDNSGTSSMANVTEGGTYTVTVTNKTNGCTSFTTTTVSSNTAAPSVNLSNTGPVSFTNASVTILASAQPGDSYVFSAGATPQGSGNTASVTTAGVYSVTVTRSDNGCSASASTTVLGGNSPTVCRSASATVNVVVGGNPMKYEWYKTSLTTPKLMETPQLFRGTATSSLTLINAQSNTQGNFYLKVLDQSGTVTIYGPYRLTVDASCRARGLAEAQPEIPVQVELAPNPIRQERLRALVRGATGRPLSMALVDLVGKPIRQQRWEQAETEQLVDWDLQSQASGVYVLLVISEAGDGLPIQRQSLKVIKP